MTVDAEIRPMVREALAGQKGAAAATQAEEGAQQAAPHPQAKDGLLYGRVKLAGLHPQLVPAIPSPETFKGSSHYPLYITNSPFVKQTIDGETSVSRNLEGVNRRPMDFETDVAYGRVEVHIRGVKSSQAHVFAGKKRFVHVAVQARFKEEFKAASMCVGQELFNDIVMPLWMRQVLLNAAAKAFSSTARVDVEGTPRYFMNPVLAACQLVNVSKPGEEPGLWDAPEDCRLMLPKAVDSHGRPLCSDKRRKWCDVAANVAGARFVPGLVYTFHFWQHYANFGEFRFSLGCLNLDMSVTQNRCPLGLTVKDVDSGRYALSLFAWHEKLLYGAHTNALADGDMADTERQLRSASGGGGHGHGHGGGGGGIGVTGRLLSGVSRLMLGGGGGGGGGGH